MKKHAKDHKTSKECWASLKGLLINKDKGRSKEKFFPLFLLESRLWAGLVFESSGSPNCCEVGRSPLSGQHHHCRAGIPFTEKDLGPQRRMSAFCN